MSSSKYLGTEQSGRVSDVRWGLSLKCEIGFQPLEIYARHREQHGKETCVGIMLGKGQQASFAVASWFSVTTVDSNLGRAALGP